MESAPRSPMVYVNFVSVLALASDGAHESSADITAACTCPTQLSLVCRALDQASVYHVHVQPPTYPLSGDVVDAVLLRRVRTDSLSGDSLPDAARSATVVLSLVCCTDQSEGSADSASCEKAATRHPVRIEAWVLSPDGIRSAEVCELPDLSDVFSRARGILETGVLIGRRVAVVGVGSGGSAIAVELAKAGVGHFSLVDFDRLEVTNVSRHVCDLRDIGRYKTRAVRDKILAINPSASVDCHELDVTTSKDEVAALVRSADLLIAGTDNNKSRYVLNLMSLELGVPALFGRVMARAAGGDVIRVRPGSGSTCLACIIAMVPGNEEITSLKQAEHRLPDYTKDKEAQVQVGLASDIQPIITMMVKLALVQLSHGVPGSGIQSLDDDLTADYYMYANRREADYKSWATFAAAGIGKMTILRWYGVKVTRPRDCLTCAEFNAIN